MRVLLVNKFLYPKGGSEKYLFELAEALKAKGHQIEYFGMNAPENIVETPKEYLVNNLDFHQKSLATLLYPFKIIYSREARQKIRMLIKKFQPDIAHLNNYNFQLTPSIIYELKKNKIPVVQTLHDPILVCPAHSLYNFQSRKICEKCKGGKFYNCIKTKCIHGSRLRSFLGALEGYLYHHLKIYDYIAKFISPSRFLADKMVEFGVDPEKLIVLHNFIKAVSPITDLPKKNYFFYFGRLSEEKGIRTLLEASKRLPDIQFVIAGKGPLESLITGHSNVKYVGFKQGEELNRLIQESLATIYPSEWYENCPMSVLESLGLGTMVIGAKIGGIPELIDDGVDGLLFEPGNVSDLTDKIRSMFDIHQKKADCLQVMKEKFEQFSIDTYCKNLIDLYQEIIVASKNNETNI